MAKTVHLLLVNQRIKKSLMLWCHCYDDNTLNLMMQVLCESPYYLKLLRAIDTDHQQK